MKQIRIVGDCFAILNNDEVIAVVSKTNETQWGVHPLISYEGTAYNHVPLHHALDCALKLKYLL